MQVEPFSIIANAKLREGDSLALMPSGKPFEPLPEQTRQNFDIVKIIIQEKLTN